MMRPSLGGDRWVVYLWEEKKRKCVSLLLFLLALGLCFCEFHITFLDPTLDLVYGYVLWFIENHSKVGLQRKVKQLNQCAALLASCFLVVFLLKPLPSWRIARLSGSGVLWCFLMAQSLLPMSQCCNQIASDLEHRLYIDQKCFHCLTKAPKSLVYKSVYNSDIHVYGNNF